MSQTTPHDHTSAVESAARRWYGLHSGDYLSCDAQQMVDACAHRLVELYDLSQRQAEDVARGTWADLRHPQADGYVETERCTPSMVVLRDAQTGRTHMLTSADLLALVRQRTRPAWHGVDFAGRDRTVMVDTG